jgi:hypothetical protein
MKKPLTLCMLFSGCLLLAGCSDADWDRALNYTGLQGSAEESEAMAADPAPRPVAAPQAEAAPPPANNDFCRAVAMQDAGDNGFDQATQQRVFARSYAQCMTLSVR